VHAELRKWVTICPRVLSKNRSSNFIA
jgi:hypothetical protein